MARKTPGSLLRSIFIILLYVFVLIDAPDAASLGGGKTSSDDYPGLYKLTDNIELFTIKSFNRKLYNKNYGLLVEFYSSWCGHCQNFAPHWRSFAKDIVGWTDIVKVAAIDCGQEENTPMCRQFEIMGYPTVRYFHENYENKSNNIGIGMKTAGDIEFLRRNLIDILQKEQTENRFTHAPNLLSYEGNEISGLWNNFTTKPFIFVIVEPENSTLASEVILDLNYMNNIAIKRVKASSPLVQLLNIPQLPSLLAVFKDLSVIPISPRNKNRQSFRNAVKVFCESKGIEIPEQPIPKFNEDLLYRPDPKEDSVQFIKRVKAMGDTVFQVDLENTVHYSLKHEISAMKLIEGEKYQTLIMFLNTLIKYFPFSENGKQYLSELKKSIEQGGGQISGEDITNYINQLEKKYNPYSMPLQWVGCRGSEFPRRGYPCGLWKLFHYLTVQSKNDEILKVMHAYVKNFFGCEHCSQHFQEMASNRNIFTIAPGDDSIIWLWESHNIVNKRLSGDTTEDPEFPKIQFPSANKCPECRDSNGEWNRSSILNYLKNMYSSEKIVHEIPNVRDMDTVNSNESNAMASKASASSSGRFLNTFDVSLYLVLYVCSAGMLVLIIRIFLRKGYRKKAYVHDEFGKV